MSTESYYVGTQNDALYIVTGKAPSPSNDHPSHEAERTAIAKVYEVPNADAIAKLFAAAPDLLECCELVIGSLHIPEDSVSQEVKRRIRAAIRKARGK